MLIISCLFFLLIPEWNLLHWIYLMGVWSCFYHTIIIPSDKAYIISTVKDLILPLSHLHHLFLVSNGSFSIASSLSASTIFKSYLALVPQQLPNHALNTLWLTLSWQRPLSYRNQSIDLLCKSMDWFLYDNGLRHERVKRSEVKKFPTAIMLI